MIQNIPPIYFIYEQRTIMFNVGEYSTGFAQSFLNYMVVKYRINQNQYDQLKYYVDSFNKLIGGV